MKIALIVVVSLVVGIGTGLGFTSVEFSRIEERFANQAYRPADAKELIEVVVKPASATVVGSDVFDFGTLRKSQTSEHIFSITNEGEDLLRVEFHSRSCGKCIATSFRTAEVSSSKTLRIPVEFRTSKDEENFSEHLEFMTNDPENPMLRLTITGKVTERIRVSAAQIRVDTASASDEVSQSFQIYGYHSDELEVLSYAFTDPATADNFEVRVTPLELSELEMDPPPLAAREVRVTMKPGMPIGPITQSLQLEVKAGEASMLNIPVVGTVTSDISVIGPRSFQSSKNMLTLGRVKREEGASVKLRIRVRGPERDNVELRVKSTDPAEALQAEIGERVPGSGGSAAHMYPLTISVPPGAPLVNRTGSDQGDFAKITIATTHSTAGQLLILVRFIIE